jgi:hypothetical protein
VGGGCEAQACQQGHQTPVHLLRERARRVFGAWPRLHVAHRDAPVEGGERPGQRGRGVAVHEQQVGLELREQRIERGQQPRCHARGRLVFLHPAQIAIDADPVRLRERAQREGLEGDRDADAFERFAVLAERLEHRSEPDDLGSRPEQTEHPLHGVGG